MYLLQEVMKVANSRQSEAIKRLEWIHSLMQPQPGFSRALVARYLGNATDYLILRIWDSPEAWTAFRQTPDGQNYPKSRPEGLYEGVAVGRAWDRRIESVGSGPDSYLVRSVYAVDAGRGDEFVANRQRHDGLALQVPGTALLETYECLDDSEEHKGTFLCIARRRDRNAYNDYLESPQAKEYRAGNTRGLYRTRSTDCYEVVSETTP